MKRLYVVILIILILIIVKNTYDVENFKTLYDAVDRQYMYNINILNKYIDNFTKMDIPIPKIIHQIWMDNKNELNPSPYMPEKYNIFSEGWKTKNNDYIHILWNGYTMDKFIKEYYPKYYSLYNSFPRWIYRCDMFRYIILHRYGGVYLDIDFVSIKPLPIWDHPVILFSDCKKGISPCGINNCILVSEPNNIFWINVLDEIKKRFLDSSTGDLVLVEITGPNMLNDITKTPDVYVEKNPCYFFNHRYNDRDSNAKPLITNCTIGYHLWDFTWKDSYRINKHLFRTLLAEEVLVGEGGHLSHQ